MPRIQAQKPRPLSDLNHTPSFFIPACLPKYKSFAKITVPTAISPKDRLRNKVLSGKFTFATASTKIKRPINPIPLASLWVVESFAGASAVSDILFSILLIFPVNFL